MSFCSNVTTTWKLIGGFLIVATITACVGGIGFWGANRLAHNVAAVGEVRMPSVDSLLTIKGQFENIRGILRTLGMAGLAQEMRDRQAHNLAKARETYKVSWETYEALPHTPEEEKVWKEFVAAWQSLLDENTKATKLFNEADQSGLPDPVAVARQLEGFMKDHYALGEKLLLLIQNKKTFEGGDNDTTCNFGRWLATFTTDSDALKQTLNSLQTPHHKFHEAVREIKLLAADGESEKALTVYEQQLTPAVHDTFRHFSDLLAVADQAIKVREAAVAQLLGPATDRMREAAALLDQLIAVNKEVTKKEGANLSRETEESLKQIIEGVEATAAKIGEIATATIEQAAGAKEVATAIQGVANVTEQSAAGSEQMSSSSQELGAQAATLKELVDQFRTSDSRTLGQAEPVHA